jgi:predicted porin
VFVGLADFLSYGPKPFVHVFNVSPCKGRKMKKSLIAIAVLTAVGAASAQSSFNLYGVADLWVGKTKDGDIKLGDDGLAGSRLGFKGTEDLGGGLKASFNMEQGVDLTTGTATGFDRQANISLTGNFGTVKLGRSFTAFDDINGAANSGFDSALSATSPAWVGYTGSANAQIYYASPALNGLSGAVGFTLTGNQSTTGATNDITSLHLKYASGPIYAGFAYQDEKRNGAAAIQHTLLNGSYDLGMATVKASFRSVKNPAGDPWINPKATEYQFGVDYPVNSSLTLSAGYANSETEASNGVATGISRSAVAYGLAAGYTLSKRTTVYGGFNASKKDGKKDSFVAAGVSHAF